MFYRLKASDNKLECASPEAIKALIKVGFICNVDMKLIEESKARRAAYLELLGNQAAYSADKRAKGKKKMSK